MEYSALRRRISEVEKAAAKARKADRQAEALESLDRLRTGDIIEVPAGKFSGWAVVLDPSYSGHEPRPYVLTADRQARRLAPMDFPVPVAAQGRMRVPRSFNGRNPAMRRDLATQLRSKVRDLEGPRRTPRRDEPIDPAAEREVARLRADLKAHPCHRCPDREDHARWAERWHKLKRDADLLQRRVEKRTNVVARTFDRVCDVLTALGYLEGDTITDRGRHLMRLYSDMDLVAAESLRDGLWDELTPSELAAVLSSLVYEARRPDDASPPRVPNPQVQDALGDTIRLWGRLDTLEKEHHLDFLREPDLGFAWAAWRWAEGDDLDEVLLGVDLAAGDFVRWMKQLLDLCGQVADASGDAPLRSTARQAIKLMKRGVVGWSALSD
jgi:ATP-dependent RNA helicase HelY